MSGVTAMDSWDKPNIHSETARLAEYPLYGPYIRYMSCLDALAQGIPEFHTRLSKPAAVALVTAEHPVVKGSPYL